MRIMQTQLSTVVEVEVEVEAELGKNGSAYLQPVPVFSKTLFTTGQVVNSVFGNTK